MKQLCQIIQINGRQQDGIITITFGDLFEVYHIYTQKVISFNIIYFLDLHEYFG
jgi:hypothetical protein